MADQNKKLERDFYEPVKSWLDKILAEKFASHHLEVTANGKFGNEVQSQIDPYRELIFSFLKSGASPDITGFVKKDTESSKEFIVVEVKDEPIKLDDIYQTKKYADLFNAKYALLVSTHEIPERIIRLAKRVVFPYLLQIPLYGRIALVHFADNGEKITWAVDDPFLQIS